MKISLKIILFVIGLALVFTIATSTLLNKLVERQTIRAQQAWAKVLASAMTETLGHDIIAGNTLHSREQILNIVKSEEMLKYIYVFDFKGRLFTHTFKNGFPRALLHQHDPHETNETNETSRKLITSKGDVLEISHPIIKGMEASIHIGINYEIIDAAIMETQTEVLRLIITFSIIGIFISLFFGRSITLPLHRLSEALIIYAGGKDPEIGNIKGSSTEIKNLLSSFQDMIDHRNKAATALRQSEERLQLTLDASSNGGWDWDITTGEAFYSDRWIDFLGYDRNEVPSKISFKESIIHPDDKVLWKESLGAHLRGDTPAFSFENRLRKSSGEYIWTLEQSQVVERNDDGSPLRFVGTGTDITAKKEDELELERYRKHLEIVVEERTASLNAINMELEAFCYSVSHDLRAPLRSIDGFSQALLEDHSATLNDEAKNYLDRIHLSTIRMSDLINDLLMLSRVTRKEVLRDTVNLSLIAENISAELMQQKPERQITFMIMPNMVAKRSDPGLLKIVLENLLGNAWKFTERQEDATINFNSEEVKGETIYSVQDNGAGFNMAYADKLFVAFQRLHTEKEFKGTGIGLVTVQRIIHRHGGRVWAEGVPEKGATIYFTLQSREKGVYNG